MSTLLIVLNCITIATNLFFDVAIGMSLYRKLKIFTKKKVR